MISRRRWVGNRLNSHETDIAIARIGDRRDSNDAHVGNDARLIIAVVGGVVSTRDGLR